MRWVLAKDLIQIFSDFDGGNICVVSLDDPKNIRLEIRKDNQSDFYQYFCFRVTGAAGVSCRFVIENAGGASFAEGWKGHQVVANEGDDLWPRIETQYDKGQLIFEFTPQSNFATLACFASYSMERHTQLVQSCGQPSGLAHHIILGRTLDGQSLDLLRFGERGKKKKKIWAIARQHPGETMAEFWMEGFLARLNDPFDPVAKALRSQTEIYVVPNMNPDGSRRGNLRTNAVGKNLNREWADPSMEKSPEVFLVRQKMIETGVDLCLDVHGDETIPHVFIAGFEGIPNLKPSQMQSYHDFRENLARITPDFQTKVGYDPTPPGKANLGLCTNWVANHFGCLAMTLEMPFKDHDDQPDDEFGWSPQRSSQLGWACLDAIWQSLRV